MAGSIRVRSKGTVKVTGLLLRFFKTEVRAQGWFLDPRVAATTPRVRHACPARNFGRRPRVFVRRGSRVGERQLLRISKALSDATRLGLLREITRAGEISCGKLARRFPVAQATVSHHLKILESAGLVAARRDGQFHYFRAVPEALDAFREGLGRTFLIAETVR
jgi:ArsR family transcriptional regulator